MKDVLSGLWITLKASFGVMLGLLFFIMVEGFFGTTSAILSSLFIILWILITLEIKAAKK